MEHLSESDVRQLYADPAAAARESRDKLAAARVWLLRHKPFFGVLARGFRLEATLGIAGYRLLPDDRLLYNPLAVLGARFPALTARLAHLSLHAALGAFARRKEREARRWNVACDLAIAPLLEAAELGVGRAPTTVFRDDAPRLASGTSAEGYYAHLQDGVAPDPLWCDLCDPPHEDAAPRGTFTRRDGGEEGDPGAPADGGDEGPSPMPAPAPTTPLDTAAHELAWKLRLAAAYEEEVAQGGPTFGEVPAWLDELLRATIEPPADWSAVLQQSIHQLHRTDRSYLRPSRRMSALVDAEGDWPDLVTMPGRRIESAGRLVAVVDTSASLPSDTLARFFGAVVATAAAEGIDELRLVQADAAIARDEELDTAELLFRQVAISGRGGTDFGPALERLAEDARRQGQRFTVVYLTDLEGRFPEPPSSRLLDVLWVTPTPPATPPPFGRLLVMARR
ncbi:MAG: hypothetical protein FJ095_10445 [Deltaproteobacteria bacterium]|nr:hypothetical protein [Deltaproteobacteria bacterium]